MIRVFIGYDRNEVVAYHVLCQSILKHASAPVSFTPLSLQNLNGLMTRDRVDLQSTDFSFSRFLVPYLCDYQGFAIFMDCDMLFLDDIAKLWEMRDEQYAVQVVKHEHKPVEKTKFLGNKQTSYEKKNWSSVMLFNNEKCGALSKDYVNTASGLELHQFKWLENENDIGGLPSRWNYLVESESNQSGEGIGNLHYTIGGPYFEEYKDCQYASDWWEAHRETNSCARPVEGLFSPLHKGS